MDPATLALIGMGSNLLGGIFQNNSNVASAREQMAFQRESMQNRYQWAYADMKKAGINPILASGINPSVGQGAMAHHENIGEAATRGAQSGSQTALAAKQLELMERKTNSEIDLNSAQASKLRNDALSTIKQMAPGGQIDTGVELSKSSANTNYAMVDKLKQETIAIVTQVQEAKQRIAQSNQMIENLKTQQQELRQNIAHSKTDQERARSQTILNQNEAKLATERKKLTQNESLIANERRKGLEIENYVKKLGLPEQENLNEYHKSPIGKAFDKMPFINILKGIF